MALFGGKESKEDKQARKAQEILAKYGLEGLDHKYADAVRNIALELSGTGMMETGLTLSLAGKAEDILPVHYQRAMVEQNFIIMRQLNDLMNVLKER